MSFFVLQHVVRHGTRPLSLFIFATCRSFTYSALASTYGSQPAASQKLLLVNNNVNRCLRHYSKAKAKASTKGKKDQIPKPRVPLTDEEMMEVIPVDELRSELAAIVDTFKQDLASKVTVRSTASFADLPVEFDGQEYPLKELGLLVQKSPQLIAINMSSLPDAIKHVLKAIQDSGMNLNPQQDGTMIYISIPKVTTEHRQALAKNAKSLFNKFKDELRITQNNYLKMIDDQPGVSSDLATNCKENVMYLAKVVIKECETLMNNKVNSLLGDQKFS